MNRKQTLTLEVMINEQFCTFTMPTNITYGNAIDAAYQIYAEVIKMASEAAEKSNPQQKEVKNAKE